MLKQRRDELSKCAFCPKLCRAACVVSEQQPREAVTPWGKMTSAYDAARSGELDAEHASLAWACSNCFRCREACDHRNPVSETLNDARADYVSHGQAPPAVLELLARREAIEAKHGGAVLKLEGEVGVARRAKHALLLGCRYAKQLPNEARSAIRLASSLVGPVRLLVGCCGNWQRAAGAATAADAARARLRQEIGSARLLVHDPRCAVELGELSPLTLVELAARHPERFVPAPNGSRYRYHDSCALGRGLGLYDEPRQLLARVLGEPPAELKESGQLSRCSGAGGLLPVSMPEVAQAAATTLVREHAELGGGVLVTSCASSLTHLRSTGAEVADLISVLSRGLTGDG
jgi:Fe-S oxidoreductase